YKYDEGTEVYVAAATVPRAGAVNQGLRILRSTAGAGALKLILEGIAGHEYRVRVRTPRRLGQAVGIETDEAAGRDPELVVKFEGPRDTYVRRDIVVPLSGNK